jgi:hypothetical protein
MSHIPRKYPFPAPAGEYQTECAYCGITWYRSELRRDEAGQLVCPDDIEGRSAAALDRLNQQAVAEAVAAQARPRRERW